VIHRPEPVATSKASNCGKSCGNDIIWQIGNKFGKVLKLWKFNVDQRRHHGAIITRAR
jgi:hypothetical protein